MRFFVAQSSFNLTECAMHVRSETVALSWPFSALTPAILHIVQFMQRLTTTHVRRWHTHRRGSRAFVPKPALSEVERGAFKSFPVQDDRHFLVVARYVERNALRASPFDKLRAGSGRAG